MDKKSITTEDAMTQAEDFAALCQADSPRNKKAETTLIMKHRSPCFVCGEQHKQGDEGHHCQDNSKTTDPMKQLEEIYDRIDVLDLEIDERTRERHKLVNRLREMEHNG